MDEEAVTVSPEPEPEPEPEPGPERGFGADTCGASSPCPSEPNNLSDDGFVQAASLWPFLDWSFAEISKFVSSQLSGRQVHPRSQFDTKPQVKLPN